MHRLRSALAAAALLLSFLLLPAAKAAVQEPAAVPPEAAAATTTSATLAVPPAAVAAARDAVYPALVNLTVVRRSFSGGRTVRVPGNGSGVVVRPEGYVLTNYHVAGDALDVRATLTSGEVLDAEVVAHDPLTDLSVLRLVAAEGRRFAAAELADADVLEVGDPVLAMGNPLALSSSVSLGIVSNPQRVFTDFAGSELEEMDFATGERTGLFTRWIQHDALILPGNSGGPLVDLEGRVVGINELGGSGFGFAIPAGVAARVLEAAIERGGVRRGWLGFQVLPVARLGRHDGALVSAVLPDSPARAAGLEPGDVLLSLDGTPVTVRFFEQVPPLYALVAALEPGAEVTLVVEREGDERTLTARAAERERSVGEQAEIARLGITVQEVTAPLALERALPTAGGLLVTGVRPGTAFEEARPSVVSGDVLMTFAGRALALPADLDAAVDAAWNGGEPAAGVTFRRGGEELVTLVRPVEERRLQRGGELPSAWLGVETQVVTPDVARALGLSEPGGFRVTEVVGWNGNGGGVGDDGGDGDGDGAETLQVGDVLRSLDGESLDASRPQDREELRRAVERRSPGERVTLGVLRPAAEGRGARKLEIAVTLEPRPTEPSVADRYRQERLEVAVREITLRDRVERGWERDEVGVLVVEVETGSLAQMGGLRIGDLILRVDGEPVPDVESFAAATERALATSPEVVPLFLRRGRRTHFVFIEPERK